MLPYLSENRRVKFPDITGCTGEGPVAVGGNLSPGVLLSAYEAGIFPWYGDDDPILWWSPEERFVLLPHWLRIPKRVNRALSRISYTYTLDADFDRVIGLCASHPRRGEGTWLTGDMIVAYRTMHLLGYAHSLEVWEGKELVGGLYGIALGTGFFGESMFSNAKDASKGAFIVLASTLGSAGFTLIDCQLHSDHLYSLGARDVRREIFIELLEDALANEVPLGSWRHNLPIVNPLC